MRGKANPAFPFKAKQNRAARRRCSQKAVTPQARCAALAAPPVSRCASGKASVTLRASRRHASVASPRAPAGVTVSKEAAPPHAQAASPKAPKARDAIQKSSSEVSSSEYILNEVVSPGLSALKAVGRALLSARVAKRCPRSLESPILC